MTGKTAQTPPDMKALQTEAIWAIREDNLDTLRYLVETMGVKLTVAAGPGGQVPAEDMTLWKGGAVADYVAQVAAAENAARLGRGAGRSIEAPQPAEFAKKGHPHAPRAN